MISRTVKRLRKDSNGVVTKVVFETTRTDDDGVSVSLMQEVPLYPPDENDFTPYENLTEQQVIDWLPVDEHTIFALDQLMADQRTDLITKGFPWSS